MKKILWGVTIVSSLIGGLYFIAGLLMSKSAPQEAATGACAVAFAVIPYCLARAWSEASKDSQ
jgi:ABC-type Mn2+/Zn2+ transport system permease subunit